ncbi:N-formylglutamate amidohydrolase, partial [Candidatus Latescibacterota bacterium]
MNKLPILISIPHGGNRVPEEVQGIIGLSASSLFDDSDAFTREIYNCKESVVEVISTDIYRAIVDVNRSPDDLPPHNPDGVVKTKTCFGISVYKNESKLDTDLKDCLLSRYYYPYHDRIKHTIENKDIQIAFDCHTMATVGPEISPDAGRERPDICLSNANGQSCDFRIVEKFVDCLSRIFSTNNIEINKPFSGGYITRNYGMKPVPWIQIEMNRSMYLSPPWFDRDLLSIDTTRLKKLNKKIREVFNMFL